MLFYTKLVLVLQFQKKEVKLKNALASLKGQREVTRNLRTKKECPVVAVVGYTNAGSASLPLVVFS